jgi:TonB family protein
MFRGSVKGAMTWALSIALLVVTAPAWADLYSATVAYEKHDYKAAFEQFEELAELGQPQAQYDLAVLYVRGEGVELSSTYGHAWASLAGKNGEQKGTALAAELEPKLTPASLKLSADIQAQYSQSALNSRLLPHLLRDSEYEDRDPVKPFKPFVPAYPRDAQLRGVQGEVFVEFTVAPDGHPRIPRILYAVPTGFFEPTVRESVMRSVFLPARIRGVPESTSVNMFYNFVVPSASIRDYGNLERRVRETKTKAESGDPSAQMLYGMMVAGLPQLHQTYAQALPWFLKAAQAGAPYAQYQIGTGLLQGRGCQCEPNKGEIWLEKAAQADQPDAQVSLAEYLLKDRSNHEAVSGAIVWLERAAKQGNSSAKLFLAAILAADPSAELRNPGRALSLTDELDHVYKHDPSLWEIRAAANAVRGDYKSAEKAQSEALAEAKELGWDLAKLQGRQSSYSARQAWTGNLLEF